MTLAPLFAASPAIQIHVVAAVAAFVLGALVLFRRKGDAPHRRLGRIWVALMAGVALTSFFIWEIRAFGLFSPIHLLSAGTLVSLWSGVRLARLHQIAAHRTTMQVTYVLALVLTGYFTFLPGRIMHEVVFGADGAQPAELVVFGGLALALLGAVLVLVVRSRAPQRRRTAAHQAS